MKEIIQLIELSNQVHEKHRLRIERLEMRSIKTFIIDMALFVALLINILIMVKQ